MPIVPTGSPAWTRAVGFGDYGGHVDKENFLGEGAINPKTDVAAEEFSRMVADMAAVARTAPFCIATFSCDDATPGAPFVEYVALMTGIRTVQYTGDDPPAGFPAFARVGNGSVTVTFDATYTDEYGVVGAFVPQFVQASSRGIGASYRIARATVSGQVATIAVVDSTGTGIANAPVSIAVY